MFLLRKSNDLRVSSSNGDETRKPDSLGEGMLSMSSPLPEFEPMTLSEKFWFILIGYGILFGLILIVSILEGLQK